LREVQHGEVTANIAFADLIMNVQRAPTSDVTWNIIIRRNLHDKSLINF